MDIEQIGIAFLFTIIGLVMLYASVIKPELSLAPVLTSVLAIVFICIGVIFFIKPVISAGIIGIALYIFLFWMALSQVTGPFIYTKSIEAVYRYKKHAPGNRTSRGTRYEYVFMKYEYQGEKIEGYSQNTVADGNKKFNDGYKYKIYINPAKPEMFVTAKWGDFIGSLFLLLFLMMIGIGLFMEYFL